MNRLFKSIAFTFLFSSVSFLGFSQCGPFNKIPIAEESGSFACNCDTLNCKDSNGAKWGLWLEEEHNPGSETEWNSTKYTYYNNDSPEFEIQFEVMVRDALSKSPTTMTCWTFKDVEEGELLQIKDSWQGKKALPVQDPKSKKSPLFTAYIQNFISLCFNNKMFLDGDIALNDDVIEGNYAYYMNGDIIRRTTK